MKYVKINKYIYVQTKNTNIYINDTATAEVGITSCRTATMDASAATVASRKDSRSSCVLARSPPKKILGPIACEARVSILGARPSENLSPCFIARARGGGGGGG